MEAKAGSASNVICSLVWYLLFAAALSYACLSSDHHPSTSFPTLSHPLIPPLSSFLKENHVSFVSKSNSSTTDKKDTYCCSPKKDQERTRKPIGNHEPIREHRWIHSAATEACRRSAVPAATAATATAAAISAVPATAIISVLIEQVQPQCLSTSTTTAASAAAVSAAKGSYGISSYGISSSPSASCPYASPCSNERSIGYAFPKDALCPNTRWTARSGTTLPAAPVPATAGI